jgi:hypothetical protein
MLLHAVPSMLSSRFLVGTPSAAMALLGGCDRSSSVLFEFSDGTETVTLSSRRGRRGGSVFMQARDVIDQYERLADGRITGVRSDGKRIWLAPVAEEAGSVVSRGGYSYALGAPRSAAAADANEPASRRREWARRVRDASSARAALAGVLLCLATGLGLGSQTLEAGAPPSAPPPTAAAASVAAAPAFERPSLTTGEQARPITRTRDECSQRALSV